jgi:hypothetical protein
MIRNVTTAATAAIAIVQAKAPRVGSEYAGRARGLIAYAPVLSPVSDPIPTNTSEPIPAAMRPGRRMSGSVGPPSPAASMMMTAPTTGDPKIVAGPPAGGHEDGLA